MKEFGPTDSRKVQWMVQVIHVNPKFQLADSPSLLSLSLTSRGTSHHGKASVAWFKCWLSSRCHFDRKTHLSLTCWTPCLRNRENSKNPLDSASHCSVQFIFHSTLSVKRIFVKPTKKHPRRIVGVARNPQSPYKSRLEGANYSIISTDLLQFNMFFATAKAEWKVINYNPIW